MPEELTVDLLKSLLAYSIKCNVVSFMASALKCLAQLLDQPTVNEINLRLFVKQLISELHSLLKIDPETYDDVSISFPEVSQAEFAEAISSINHLNPTPVLGMLREVYYAYEPIVTLRSVLIS